LNDLQLQLQQTQAQIESLEQQEADLHQVLSRATEIETALASLHQARTQLTHLDQTQAQVAPLLQRRQQLQTQLDRASARLTARLDELRTSAHYLQTQQERQPKIQQAVAEISDRIETLEQRRAYQQSVLDKGMERRTFMERLQAEQRECETTLAEVEQKIQLLKQELPNPQLELVTAELVPAEPLFAESVLAEPVLKVAESNGNSRYSFTPSPVPSPTSHPPTPYPPCPLCDRPLDEHHWQVVLAKHQQQHEETLSQIWVIREQLSASEREIQVLRQEYRDIDKELGQYSTVLERRGQLQEQLQATVTLQTSLRQVLAEVDVVEQALDAGNFAQELQEELQLLDRSLHQLHYDERDHALARGQVDRWRWAEIKQAEIKQAQRKQAQLENRRPDLQARFADLQAELAQVQQQTQADLDAIAQHTDAIGYDLEQHNQLQAAVRQTQPWQLRYQELYRAQQNYPRSLERLEELSAALQERQSHLHTAHTHVQALLQQLEQLPDCQSEIQTIDQQMQQRRSRLDAHLAHLGRLQQQQQQLVSLGTQHINLSAQLHTAHRRLRVYQELAQAFGKNGIQTLMIENVLPQLEAETNHILGRLSANQLHVQFVTQRSNRREGKHSKLKMHNAKLIETLDILIADAHGTRPYETYSGGEAFRVNFAIRLALSRLLAQRSGTALQLLIIDEGFGTQDQEGCDRLIAAINAIASDFACILAVTHVPHLKEAFQSRIEVYKTQNGSQISLAASL
jgi:exonuclease SbcC